MSDWTPAREKQLRDKWDEGVSSGVIANDFGMTRSQVCGKVRRMGLEIRTEAPATRTSYDNSRRAANAQAKAPSRPAPPRQPMPLHLTPPTIWKRLLELELNECRWPLGERHARDFVFCALPAEGAFPYCACHARMAYQKVAA